MLTLPSTYTNPMPVVAGDGFDLFVVLRNVGAVELESVVVTYIIEASSGLILADTTNVVNVPWLRPDSQAPFDSHALAAVVALISADQCLFLLGLAYRSAAHHRLRK
jgi:hypothetical protein